jgi:NAD(P)-dependent dehydrogenase (short-subunit alcohol dehydrogenase family)
LQLIFQVEKLKKINMKTVLITGANKGIGFETAKQLAELNYFVYLGCRDVKHGKDAIQRLNELGLVNVEAITIDVSDINNVKRARKELEMKTSSLDVLINNAGIVGDEPQDLATCNLDALRRIFETNFFGVIQTTQEFLPLLTKSKQASIISVSSEVGSLNLLATPGGKSGRDKYHAYGSSKTALNAFTVMLANEFRGTGLSVNSVTPGHTATDLNGFLGTKSVEQGASPIIKLVTQSNEDVTAKFFKEGGEASW